jgi:hypothetical protein
MTTAGKNNDQSKVKDVPTRPVEAGGITAAATREQFPRFTRMALESTDFVASSSQYLLSFSSPQARMKEETLCLIRSSTSVTCT